MEALEVGVERLRRSGKAQRRELAKVVRRQTALERVVENMGSQISEQTREINKHVDSRYEQMQSFVLDQIVEVARSWSASAIVTVTFVLTIVAGVVAAWVMSATGHVHVH
ncbi:MAG TPA: hypothetical protein VG265_07230 [Gaiellaceae bacterium]|nr:hypothetical protein [Gaiellaceae bacterium]